MKINSRVITQITIFSLLLGLYPSSGVHAGFSINQADYQECAQQLQTTDISEDKILMVCAETLYPKQLAHCVTRIVTGSGLPADDAVKACYMVRRPVDLSYCVNNINQQTRNANPKETLDFCRRSLLPADYSNCVVGLAQQLTDISARQAMISCISANTYQTDLNPTYVPQNITQPDSTKPDQTPSPSPSPSNPGLFRP